MASKMSSGKAFHTNRAIMTNRAVPLSRSISSSKTPNQPKINQSFLGRSEARKAFAVQKDVSGPSSKPKSSSQTDKQHCKEWEKAYAGLQAKFNDEKQHSQDLSKEMAELRAVKAETAGLTIKRLREQIEDRERDLRIEKLQTLGYGLLLKHVERDVRQWACKYGLPVEELPNFSLWDEVPDTGFQKPRIKKSDFSILSDYGKGGSKRKRGEGDDDDEITAAKRKNVMGWQRAQEDQDQDDDSDYEFESETVMLARIKRETKALISK